MIPTNNNSYFYYLRLNTLHYQKQLNQLQQYFGDFLIEKLLVFNDAKQPIETLVVQLMQFNKKETTIMLSWVKQIQKAFASLPTTKEATIQKLQQATKVLFEIKLVEFAKKRIWDLFYLFLTRAMLKNNFKTKHLIDLLDEVYDELLCQQAHYNQAQYQGKRSINHADVYLGLGYIMVLSLIQ